MNTILAIGVSLGAFFLLQSFALHVTDSSVKEKCEGKLNDTLKSILILINVAEEVFFGLGIILLLVSGIIFVFRF